MLERRQNQPPLRVSLLLHPRLLCQRTRRHHSDRKRALRFTRKWRDAATLSREPHGRDEFIEIDGFGQIIDRPVAHGGDCATDISKRRHEEHGERRVLLADAPR